MFRLIVVACSLILLSTGFIEGKGIGNLVLDNLHLGKLERFFSKKETPEDEKPGSKHTVCRTEECFKVAAELWESLNRSVDPCEDFYEYACGSWALNNPVPPTEMLWDSITKTEKLIQDRVRDLLEEGNQPDDILPVKLLKRFYQSCMNVDELEKIGLKPLEAILTRNGGWPAAMEFEEWDPNEFTWQRIDKYYLKLTGSSALFDIMVTPDFREIDYSNYTYGAEMENMVLKLSIPKLPSVVLKNHDQRFNRTSMYENGSYAKFMKEVALAFAHEREAHISEEQLDTDIKEMIELEKKLEFIHGRYYKNHKCMTLMELQATYDNISHHTEISKINWKATVIDYLAVANVEINEDEDICISLFTYLSYLAKLLDETKPRTIVNYVHWKFLTEFISYTTSQMRKLQYDLTKAVAGVKEETPRWEMCVEETKMEHALAYQFIQKFFKDEMKEDAERLFSGVQKAVIKHILKADWLDDEMRKLVLRKIKKMEKNIGYPNWYNNVTVLTNYYRGMVIGHQFVDNLISYKIFSLKKTLRSLHNNRNTVDEWTDVDPLMVNAFYNPYKNILTIPAGEFQTVFYSPTLPRIITYGNVGFTMGHEVSHGFDVDGINYNENGNRVKSFNDGMYEYNRRSNCYISQLEDYYTDELTNDDATDSCSGIYFIKCFFMRLLNMDDQYPIREIATQKLGENMADSMGVEMIFEALEEIEQEKNSPRFPGFEDMTNEQFFFVSYANVWCHSSTPQYKNLMENYDPHSKPRYRVIATVQNSEEFAKAYKCPKGSPMNPERKCKIW